MEEDAETRSEKLKSLRRHVAEEWLEGPGKETALNVLDEMVFEAAGESPLNSDLVRARKLYGHEVGYIVALQKARTASCPLSDPRGHSGPSPHMRTPFSGC